MRLKKALEQVEKSSLFSEGVLNLDSFAFSEVREIEELSSWLEGQKLHTLSLQNCNICETPSILSTYINNGLNGLSLIPPASTSQKFKALYKNKADALVFLLTKLQWVNINLSTNNLCPSESEKIIKAITTTQKNLRSLNFGFNALSGASVKLLSNYIKNENMSSCLKYLLLPGTLSSNISKSFPLFIEALRNNRTIRELDLSSCGGLTDHDLRGLIEIMNQKPLSEEELNKLPKQNSTLTVLHLTDDAFSPELIKELKECLKINKHRQNEFLESLISRERLLAHAVYSVKNDDDAWLDILIGVDKKESEEEFIFNKEQYDFFFRLRALWFQCSIINCQYAFLQGLKNEDFENESKVEHLEEQLAEIIREAMNVELRTIAEDLTRASLDIHEGCLIPLTSERKDEILQIFNTEIVIPTVQLSRLKLRVDTDLAQLTNEYKERSTILETRSFLTKNSHVALIQAHIMYPNERKRLITKLKSLDLNKTLQHELEEISNRIIEVHIDPNSIIDEDNNTLLHLCFSLNKVNCLKLLLKKGANILAKNKAGVSVLGELLSSTKMTMSHQIVIEHIQVVLDTWFTAKDIYRIEELKTIKHNLDEYLKILIKNSLMPKIQRFVTGVDRCLEERKQELEEYYSCLQEATQQTEENSLDAVLNQMLEIAHNAKRGWLEHSKLHDSMEKELVTFFRKSDLHTMKDQLDQAILEFETQFIEYQADQELKRKKDEALDSDIELFEILDISTENKDVSTSENKKKTRGWRDSATFESSVGTSIPFFSSFLKWKQDKQQDKHRNNQPLSKNEGKKRASKEEDFEDQYTENPGQNI